MLKSNEPQLAGVVGFFGTAKELIAATEKVRDANFQSFDTFTPYPVHGLEKAQGLKRSPIPYITLGAGLTGFMSACALQYWTSAVDWPLNVGGKPLWSWPAFVPIMFELTVLFAGLCTVGGMFLLNGFPNTKKKSFDPNVTRDRFAIMIDAPTTKSAAQLEAMEDAAAARYRAKVAKFKAFNEDDAKQFLKQLGAQDVRSVQAQGWF